MSTFDYDFDPTGVNPANKITGETQTIDITTNVMVMPINHPFFAESLTEIVVTDGTNIKKLHKGSGFLLSPLFLEAGARCTGKIINTYLIIIDKDYDWTGISMDYQTLGQYQDTLLLTELNGITFNPALATSWLKIKGGAGFYDVYQRGGRLANRTMMDVFAEGLDNISNNLLSPPGSNTAWGQRISELEKQVISEVSQKNVKETVIDTSLAQVINVVPGANYVVNRVSALNVIASGKVMNMTTPTYTAGNRSITTLPGGYFLGTVTSDKGYPWWKRSTDTSVMCRIGGKWFLYAPGLQYCYVSANICELPTQATAWNGYDLGINTNLSGATLRETVTNMFTYHDIEISVSKDIVGSFYVGDYMGSMALGINKVSAPHHVGLPAPVGTLTLTEAGAYAQFSVSTGLIRKHVSGKN